MGWVLWFGFLTILEASTVSASLPSITLAWNPSPANNIGGYRLYLGLSSGLYATWLDVGATTNATLANLTPGTTYFFAVTAYDTNQLESPFSGEISYMVPAPPNLARLQIRAVPGNKIQLSGNGPVGYTYALLTSTDLKNWTNLATVVMDATGSFVFFDTRHAGIKENFYRLRQILP